MFVVGDVRKAPVTSAPTPGLKLHAVTLFEGGRVAGAAVMSELVSELWASFEGGQSFEGDMARLTEVAVCVRACVRARACAVARVRVLAIVQCAGVETKSRAATLWAHSAW